MKSSLFNWVFMFLITFSITKSDGGYKIGDTATDFKLKGVDGKMHSLSEVKNANGYVVIFTCNHCPFSVAYEDRIIALHKKYEKKGYPVIAINPNDPEINEDDSFEKMKIRAKEKNFPFLYLFDEGQKIYPQYGATKTPHVFLLNKDKKVIYIGSIDDSSEPKNVKVNYLENAIEANMAGKEINPNQTKAIGCGIKAKK